MSAIKNLGCLIVGAATAAGLFGVCAKIVSKLDDKTKAEMKAPKEEDFKNYLGVVIHPNLPYTNRRDVYILDEDNDGTADVIYTTSSAWYVADGFQSKRFHQLDAITMTAEMRQAATESLKADQRLSYLLAKRAYEIYQKQ